MKRSFETSHTDNGKEKKEQGTSSPSLEEIRAAHTRFFGGYQSSKIPPREITPEKAKTTDVLTNNQQNSLYKKYRGYFLTYKALGLSPFESSDLALKTMGLNPPKEIVAYPVLDISDPSPESIKSVIDAMSKRSLNTSSEHACRLGEHGEAEVRGMWTSYANRLISIRYYRDNPNDAQAFSYAIIAFIDIADKCLNAEYYPLIRADWGQLTGLTFRKVTRVSTIFDTSSIKRESVN
jgi:hypothetical protein